MVADKIIRPTWDDITEVCADTDMVVGFAGAPGVGKTSFTYKIGEDTGRQVYKIQFHSEYSPSEIMGMHVPDPKKGFRWEPGPGDKAYNEGAILLLDELDQASGPCKTYCYALLDPGPGGTIAYVGREFEQHQGYQGFATMNGDPTDGSLPEALLNRFDAWFIITEPSEDLYALLDEDLRELCRKAYSSAKDPMAGPEFTFRQFKALQTLRTTLPLDKALLAACYGRQDKAYSAYETIFLSKKTPRSAEIVDER